MTDWTKEEDEAFNAVEKQSNLGKQILKAQGQPYHFDVFVSISQRNQVLEEVAKEIEKMTVFGKDTISSFTIAIRNMKVCPPCYGNCNQGRNCPARNTCLVRMDAIRERT
jgi:VCBS repeat-containing protein